MNLDSSEKPSCIFSVRIRNPQVAPLHRHATSSGHSLRLCTLVTLLDLPPKWKRRVPNARITAVSDFIAYGRSYIQTIACDLRDREETRSGQLEKLDYNCWSSGEIVNGQFWPTPCSQLHLAPLHIPLTSPTAEDSKGNTTLHHTELHIPTHWGNSSWRTKLPSKM
jgi:hypothetical protein